MQAITSAQYEVFNSTDMEVEQNDEQSNPRCQAALSAIEDIERTLSPGKQVTIRYNSTKAIVFVNDISLELEIVASVLYSGGIGGGLDHDYLGEFPNRDAEDFGIATNSQELVGKCEKICSQWRILVGERGSIPVKLFKFPHTDDPCLFICKRNSVYEKSIFQRVDNSISDLFPLVFTAKAEL